jgi:uncharacterized membrane protein
MKSVDHSRHNIYKPTDIGAKAADVITSFVGSWLFVGIHTVWFIVWIVLRVEAFPYGLLTLLVSLEAIFLSTFVMMSQNRSAQRDHLRDDHEAEEVDILFRINQTQLEILQLLRRDLCTDEGAVPNGMKAGAKKADAQPTVPAQSARALVGKVTGPSRSSRGRRR